MSLPLAIALFFVIWWVVLFAVLPFGVRTQGESGEVVPGTPESAPTRFLLARVAMINTIVAIVVFIIVWIAIELDIFGISEIANQVGQPGGGQ